MDIFVSITFCGLTALWLLWLIGRFCQRNPAMARVQSWLVVFGLLWCAMVTAKLLVIDDVFPPVDGARHESIARRIADSLSAGDWRWAGGFFRPGNSGYRFLLGVLYALTGAPQAVVYFIHGALAFWGLLFLVETLCLATRCVRIPTWLVTMIAASPSALFWTTANLKEGCLLWGICMMLRFSLWTAERSSHQLTCPLAGLLVVGFMRPHFAIAWMCAIAVGLAVRQQRFSVAILTLLGALAGFQALQMLRPEMVQDLTEHGLVDTLEAEYERVSHIGGSQIQYYNGRPTPVVSGLLLLFLRPFPHELFNLTSLLAGLEIWFISFMSFLGWYRTRNRLALGLTPFVITNIVAILLISIYFSYMYNMGLMVRQRLMALPALFVVLAVPWLTFSSRWATPAHNQQLRAGHQHQRKLQDVAV